MTRYALTITPHDNDPEGTDQSRTADGDGLLACAGALFTELAQDNDQDAQAWLCCDLGAAISDIGTDWSDGKEPPLLSSQPTMDGSGFDLTFTELDA